MSDLVSARSKNDVSASVRGARTRACSVHTRVNASSPLIVRTRPGIILSLANQSSLHRVILYVSENPFPLPIVPHPMVVRFPLPERLARSAEYKVRPSGRNAFERLQQHAWRDHRQQQNVHMVCHDGKCSEIELAQFNAFEQRGNYQFRNSILSQEHRTGSSAIHIAVHPNKCLAGGELMRRRIPPVGKAPVEMPSNEEPLTFGIDVGQPAGGMHCSDSATYALKISLNRNRGARICGARTPACSVHTRVNASSPVAALQSSPQGKCAPTAFIRANQPADISRSHECERCTQECVRHEQVKWSDNGVSP
jgi:hypothetical protein